ncbi:sulfotransferase family protein [Marinobacter sp. F4218]|uniref:sulfotransferase family protein n=1 Tax=Marinobacter sp. F4218 TaxID=2862868 RepID=UPI001C62F95B|nr:sulfotransferase [Marinobacter sp. F4218]MBW7470445.1 sulfotransferase [Marinobacter sp. F4218]
MNKVTNIEPVFLLGTARSGTTMLGETLLSCHAEIAYLGEINYLWKYGHDFSFYDDIDECRYTDNAISVIRNQIVRQAIGRNPRAKIFIDKTPANCLRVEVLLRAFPNAKFIHLTRNGEAVARSAVNEWLGQAGSALDSAEVRKKPLLSRLYLTIKRKSNLRNRVFDFRSFVSLMAYFPDLFRLLARMLGFNAKSYWGPKFKGIKELVKSQSLNSVCYKQWEHCHDQAIESLEYVERNKILNVQYELICRHPRRELENIFSFLELPVKNEVIEQMVAKVINR